MEFKTRFEVEDIVYFYTNEKTHMFDNKGYLEPNGMFIQEGQIFRIMVDYVKDNHKRIQPFITYKVRIGSNIVEDVHEDFLAHSVDELCEQSKKLFVSKVSMPAKKKKKR